MKMIALNLIVEKTGVDEYWGYSPDLPGLHILGKTPAEVVNLAPGIAHTLLQVRHEKKLKMPSKFARFDGSQTIKIEQGTPAHALPRTDQKTARARM